jgi:regulator of PEP synthase PpsR (kinase-PPPase family)
LVITEKPVLYVISDALGETGELVVKAAISQFDASRFIVRRYPYVSEKNHIADVIDEASGNKSIIVYTLVVKELEDYLIQKAAEHNIPVVDILGPVISTLAKVANTKPKMEPGLIRKMDEQYFRKVDAVDFAVKYDDGKDPRGIIYADLVVIGVSRTSKTPLCMYLAHKRLRVANIPLVPEVAPAEELFTIPPSKIFGLTISANLLYQIRTERLKSLGLKENADYASMARIQKELDYADKIMKKLGCHVIDVTNRAVEETASKVIGIYTKEEENGR